MDRPTALWRFLQFPLTRLVIGLVAVIGATTLVQLAADALQLRPEVGALLATAAMVITYVVFVRLVERRPVAELARARAGGFLPGVILGAVLFGSTMLVLAVLGVAHVGRGDGWRAAAVALVMAIVAGVGEEIVVRGVVFRIVEDRLGSWIAVALSAALFGLLHAFNPGATTISTLSIAFEAGVLLAAAYIFSRGLWLPIGLHIGWNFTERGIFGAAVSGNTGQGLLHSDFTGATLLGGGAFGPEASLVAVVVCCGAGLVLLALARQRGHIVAPRWRRRGGAQNAPAITNPS
jgi:membrane protease YdiL (CAAX protease family)